jgi:hypothetical protein
VELIAHCRVQVSLNSTAPVARYSFVRHEFLGGGLVVPVLSALAGAASPLAYATTISFFGFAGEILKLREGKSPASAAWGYSAARPTAAAEIKARRNPILIAASICQTGWGGAILSMRQFPRCDGHHKNAFLALWAVAKRA